MQSLALVKGQTYQNTRGDHTGEIVVLLSYSPNRVRFNYARKTRKTDSERWHAITRAQFERDFIEVNGRR